ncbi:phage exclusion protein Lit family protein [Chitinophaga varians]|uniref:phage exclusion protein Lit family protein n=1 Tax=Chitinophaga varians TaxID=2202339 RepID=UPI00165F2A59|nr:phage exclusion protein Lit family protein [Chitinophaga varians]MBC9909827.1 hypothetical protein [Chitinophaga varians]
MIDHRSLGFKGQSPVAVLQNNFLHEFENLFPGFKEYAKELIGKGEIDPEITYDAMDTRVKSPFAMDTHIYVTEGLASFIWCMAYSLMVFHHEITVKLGKNNYLGNQNEQPDKELVKQGLDLFDYAMLIKNENKDWDLKLPNPAYYPENQQDLIEKVNAVCVNAMKFVIGHEFAHIELQHTKANAPMSRKDGIALSINQEKEADARALELVLRGTTPSGKDTLELGILVGLFSILMLQESNKSEGYPDTDDRLGVYLENLKIDDDHYLWAVAVQGYKLWDLHYGKNMVWPSDRPNYKAVYFAIREQLKKDA